MVKKVWMYRGAWGQINWLRHFFLPLVKTLHKMYRVSIFSAHTLQRTEHFSPEFVISDICHTRYLSYQTFMRPDIWEQTTSVQIFVISDICHTRYWSYQIFVISGIYHTRHLSYQSWHQTFMRPDIYETRHLWDQTFMR